MYSGSVDAGFVLALPFHHLEPDCIGVSMRGEAYAWAYVWDKIDPQDFALKMQGGLMREVGRICGTLRYNKEP